MQRAVAGIALEAAAVLGPAISGLVELFGGHTKAPSPKPPDLSGTTVPTFQAGASGRDHNPDGFTAWMMGAGVKAPYSYGATDEFGHKAIENIATVYDFHKSLINIFRDRNMARVVDVI